MKKDEKIRVGISVGDLNGIGTEIIMKTFEDVRMLEFYTPVIFASIRTMSFVKKHLQSPINFHGASDITQILENKINVINVWKDQVNIEFGVESMEVGAFAIQSLQAATEALKNNHIDVLVTAPINKHNIQSESFKFPGHTNYLAQELGGNSLMFMVHEHLKVGLLTDHVPVKDVSQHITPQLIQQKVDTIYESLQVDFRISKPKIAILAINPHAGDNGVIGDEDDTILKPTIEKIREKGRLVFGPYSADSFFGSKNYTQFDAIIASYHDQGLIPFKTITFGEGVNFTAGLSKVRTSPDHGTAYEIAGKGIADESSFKEAVFTAIQIYKNRKEYAELTLNPLKTGVKKI